MPNRNFLISLNYTPISPGSPVISAVTDFIFNPTNNTWHGEHFTSPSSPLPDLIFDGGCSGGFFTVSILDVGSLVTCGGTDVWLLNVCDCSLPFLEFDINPSLNPFSECACFQDESGQCGFFVPYISFWKSVTIYDPGDPYGYGYGGGYPYDAICPGCDETTFHVIGCNSMPVPDATITIRDHLGAEVAHGVSDDNGDFTVQGGWCGASATITHARFNEATASALQVPCNGTVTFDLVSFVASGYACTSRCAEPLATTLHATHPLFGAITYTYNGSGSRGAGWYATISYSYPGCNGCPARTITINHYLDTDLNLDESWQSD